MVLLVSHGRLRLSAATATAEPTATAGAEPAAPEAAARSVTSGAAEASTRSAAAFNRSQISRPLGSIGTGTEVAVELTGGRRRTIDAVPAAVVVFLPAATLVTVDIPVMAGVDIATTGGADGRSPGDSGAVHHATASAA